MKEVTKTLHLRVENDGTAPAVTPLYRCSAFTADSPYFYSRKNNPNVAELEEVLCTLEGAGHAVAVSCGMTTIYAVLDFLTHGDLLVANKFIYGCTFKLLQLLSERRGFDLKVLDLSREKICNEIPANTKMVFFETPTNPFLRTVNIRMVADHMKKQNPEALVVVDNTWATPLFQHPLEFGADISLHSGTKYFSGHSDVMSGVLLTDREDIYEELLNTRFYGGLIISPDNAWLTRRSLQTLAIRLGHHQDVTEEMCEFLESIPQVEKVYYPEVDGEQLTGYGGIIFFDLRNDLIDRYEAFSRALKLFETGTGMACVTSMVAQPYTGSHASMTPAEKNEMGLGPGLVRLCFGLEDRSDLKDDLMSAFRFIDS